jgi:hypothetical protein
MWNHTPGKKQAFSALTSTLCLCYALCFWEADSERRGQSRSKSREMGGGRDHRSNRRCGREGADRITIGISTPMLPRPAMCRVDLSPRPCRWPRGGQRGARAVPPPPPKVCSLPCQVRRAARDKGLCPVEGAAHLRRTPLRVACARLGFGPEALLILQAGAMVHAGAIGRAPSRAAPPHGFRVVANVSQVRHSTSQSRLPDALIERFARIVYRCRHFSRQIVEDGCNCLQL